MTEVRDRANSLRAKIAGLTAELQTATASLSNIERRCHHEFGEIYRSVEMYRKAVLGAPIHQGSDLWYQTDYVDDTRTVWKRKCIHCDRVVETRTMRAVETQIPDFR